MEDYADLGLLSLTVALSLLLARFKRKTDGRSESELLQHYRIERELADRLRRAPRHERRTLYTSLYDELFRRVSSHPQRDISPEKLAVEVERQYGFLQRFLRRRHAYMELGAGDCAMALKVAAEVERVCVVEVSEEITRRVQPPKNFSLILSDGCSIDVPADSIDLAYSNQLMEHLHPEDAEEQLRNIYRSLRPGGRYVCITPNRHYGPRDISEYFDEVATGFHLKEYSAAELRALMKATGFSHVSFYAGARGWYVPCPYWLIAMLETALEKLPRRRRKLIADFAPLRAVLGLRVCARK